MKKLSFVMFLAFALISWGCGRYVSTFLSPFVKKIFIIFFPDSESLHSPVSTV